MLWVNNNQLQCITNLDNNFRIKKLYAQVGSRGAGGRPQEGVGQELTPAEAASSHRAEEENHRVIRSLAAVMQVSTTCVLRQCRHTAPHAIERQESHLTPHIINHTLGLLRLLGCCVLPWRVCRTTASAPSRAA